jgi:hypothetical protein
VLERLGRRELQVLELQVQRERSVPRVAVDQVQVVRVQPDQREMQVVRELQVRPDQPDRLGVRVLQARRVHLVLPDRRDRSEQPVQAVLVRSGRRGIPDQRDRLVRQAGRVLLERPGRQEPRG